MSQHLPFYALIWEGMSECCFPFQGARELFPVVQEKGEGKNKGSTMGLEPFSNWHSLPGLFAILMRTERAPYFPVQSRIKFKIMNSSAEVFLDLTVYLVDDRNEFM